MRSMQMMAAGLLLVSGIARAELTGTVGVVSDYDFRGITQTGQDPAVQGSIDYSHESGWYAGAWASNVDFGSDANLEVDWYTGISGGAEDGLGWDAGIVYYTYFNESDINFPEIYAGLSYGKLSGKLWYSNDFGNSGDSAYYLEGNADIPLPADFSLQLHLGYSGGDFWDNPDEGYRSYYDYSVGVSRSFGHFDLGLKWVDGSDLKAYDGTPRDLNSSEARLVFSISTTFPWSSE